MKILHSTLATAMGIGLTSSLHAEIEEINKGPYTIMIDSQGEFGSPSYKYEFRISHRGKEIVEKASESSIRGWLLNTNALLYNDANDSLWVIYEQIEDGLDPKEIHLVKITKGNPEEAVAIYDPLKGASSLELQKIPDGWNKIEIIKILKNALGGEQTQDQSQDQSQSQEDTTSTSLKQNEPVNQISDQNSSETKINNSQKPKSREVSHSMEW
jgi:hypothetical protein